MIRSSAACTAGQWLARKTRTTTSSLRSDKERLVCSPLGEAAGIPEKSGALSPIFTALLKWSANTGTANATTAKLRRIFRIDAHSIQGCDGACASRLRTDPLSKLALARDELWHAQESNSYGALVVRPKLKPSG